MLLKQAMPGLAKNTDGGWDSGPLAHLRDLADKPAEGLQISFKSVDVLTVREDGHRRLLLLTDENSGGTGFDGVLAAFDLDARTPKFLDDIDAGRDQWNSISHVFALSAGTDGFIASSSHSNSNQSYQMSTPLFLRRGRFQPVMTLFTFGSSACNYATTQEPTFTTRPAPGSPYRALLIGVTVETTPGDPDCGEGVKPLRRSHRVYAEIYRWNAARRAFVGATGVIEKLSDRNWKAATE